MVVVELGSFCWRWHFKCLSCLRELNWHSAGFTSSDGGHYKGCRESQGTTINHRPSPSLTHAHPYFKTTAATRTPLSLTALSVQEEVGWCMLMWLHTLDDSWLLYCSCGLNDNSPVSPVQNWMWCKMCTSTYYVHGLNTLLSLIQQKKKKTGELKLRRCCPEVDNRVRGLELPGCRQTGQRSDRIYLALWTWHQKLTDIVQIKNCVFEVFYVSQKLLDYFFPRLCQARVTQQNKGLR